MAPHNWEGEMVTQRQAGTQSRINILGPQKRIGRGMENMIHLLMLCLYYYSLLYNLTSAYALSLLLLSVI